VTDEYEIRKGIPLPQSNKQTGLTSAIRKMEYLDSITIPGDKISSVHPCASQAGAKVKTEKNADGTVTVWRVDLPVTKCLGPAATEPGPVAISQPMAVTKSGPMATESARRPNASAIAKSTIGAPGSVADKRSTNTSPKIILTVANPALGLPAGYYANDDPYGPMLWIEGKPPELDVAAASPADPATEPGPVATPKQSIFD
jgi:hypothetical protein